MYISVCLEGELHEERGKHVEVSMRLDRQAPNCPLSPARYRQRPIRLGAVHGAGGREGPQGARKEDLEEAVQLYISEGSKLVIIAYLLLQ